MVISPNIQTFPHFCLYIHVFTYLCMYAYFSSVLKVTCPCQLRNVFGVSFMYCLQNYLSQILCCKLLLLLGLGIILPAYPNMRGLQTLGNQSLIYVFLGKPIKFLLNHEWDMFVWFLYEAIAHCVMFLLTPLYFWVEGNKSLFSLVFDRQVLIKFLS